jgi:hypothetical protein
VLVVALAVQDEVLDRLGALGEAVVFDQAAQLGLRVSALAGVTRGGRL